MVKTVFTNVPIKRIMFILVLLFAIQTNPAFSATYSTTVNPGWRLLSIPVKTNPALNACEMFGADRTFSVEGQTYTTCSSAINMTPGRGVLIFVDEEFFVEVEGEELKPSESVTVKLSPGWNEIGTPSTYSISAESSLFIDGVPITTSSSVRPGLYGYDPESRKYYETFYMYPWEGYLIYSYRSAELRIVPVAGEGAPGAAVTLDIMNGPGATAARVSAVDMDADDTKTLWAAGFDAHNRFSGNIAVTWSVDGTLGIANGGAADHIDIAPKIPGAAGSISATYGNLTSRNLNIVVFGTGDNYAYPFSDNTPTATDSTTGTDYIRNQVLVTFGQNISDSQARFIIESSGGTVVGRNTTGGTYQVKIPAGADAAEYIAGLESAGQIQSAGLNYIFEMSALPTDPVFQNSAPAAQKWYIGKTGVDVAWDAITAKYAPMVAVLDSGIDISHPELSNMLTGGKNFIDPSIPDDVTDGSGHGTAVAGIVAAERDNGTGGAGICGNCSLMPVKVCDSAGRCPAFQVAAGIAYASSNGADIINMSFGAQLPESSSSRTVLQTVIDDAAANGALIIAAAGNENSDSGRFVPASLSNVLAVGATDENNGRASFSGFGASVDISAPGINIYTTLPSSQFGYAQGTSVSTAIVSGIAGLMKSTGKIATPETLASILTDTATLITTDQPIGGLINAAAAIQNIISSNFPPTVSSITIPGATAVAGATVSVSINASDPDGDDISIAWSADGGTIVNATSANAAWTLPGSAGIYEIKVKVTDTLGSATLKTSYILVMNGALSDIRVTPSTQTLKAGETVQLSALCIDDSFGSAGVECPVSWTSDSAAGTVTSGGIFTALSSGASVITATLDGISGTAIMYVEYAPGAILYTAADTTPCGANWMQPLCNTGNTGESSLKLTPPLTYKYYRTLAEVGILQAAPVVYNGNFYFGSNDGRLFGINVSTFADLAGWPINLRKSPTTTSVLTSSPIIDPTGQYIYINSVEGYIYKYDIPSGNKIWEWTPDATKLYAFQSSPYVDGNVIYLVSGIDAGAPSGRIYAISDNVNSASLLWSYPPSGSGALSSFNDSSPGVVTSGATKMVFAATASPGGRTYVVDALNGSLIHNFYQGVAQDCSQTPAANGVFIYVACDITGVSKYDLTPVTGGLKWNAPIGKVRTPPAYKNGQIFVATVDLKEAHALRDNTTSYAEDIWPAPVSLGGDGPYAHPTIYAGGGTNGRNETTEDAVIFPTNGNGALYILSLADGHLIEKVTTTNTLATSVVTQVGTNIEIIVLTTNGMYIYEKNFPPTITSVTMNEVPTNGTPMIPGATSSASATVYVSDLNGLKDISKVYIDLTPIRGTSSNNLTEIGVSPSSQYSNIRNTVLQLAITPPEGIPAGLLNFDFYVVDKGGLSATAQGNIDIADVAPSFISATFSRSLYHDGIDSVNVNVTVKDANIVNGQANAEPVVRIDLDQILDNNSVPNWVTLTCGNGYVSGGQKMDCSYSAVTSTNGRTPGLYNIPVQASDSANTVSTTAPLTLVGITGFSLTPSPLAPDTGNATTITVTASNIYGLIPNYNNSNPLAVTMANGTAGSMTYGGAGITGNPDGTATIAAGSFVSGSFQFTVTNTKDDTGVTFTITDIFGANGTSAAVQWVPRTLGSFGVVWTPVELVKDENANVQITALDPFGNTFKGFQNPNGLTIVHKSGASVPSDLTYDETSGVMTDNGDGTADFASGASTFTNGISSFTVSNKNDDPAVIFTVNEKTSAITGDSNPIEWLLGVLGVFDFVQVSPVLPGNPVAGATATLRITAYDKSINSEVLTNYNNEKDILITKAGGTGSTIRWGGPGVVDNNDGTARILGTDNGGGVFSNGFVEIEVRNTKVEIPTFTIREYDRTPNITDSTPVEWEPDSIAYFDISLGVSNPSMIVGETATLNITAKDQFANTCTSYSNISGVSLVQSFGVAGTGIVWTGTDVQFSGVSNPPNYSDLIIGNGTAFNNGAAVVQIKNTEVSYGVTVTVTDIASGKNGSSPALDWTPGALSYFVVEASPIAITAGSTSTVTVTAYDIYDNIKTNFSSNVTMATTNGTTSGITWSGTNVSTLAGGTGRINTAGWNNGAATAIIRNTVAEGPVILKATYTTISSQSLPGVSPTWYPGPLNSIIIRNAANNAGSPIGNVTMKSSDSLSGWAAGYDQYNNYISDVNSDWITNGTLDLQTALNTSSFIFNPATVETSGKIKATENGGTIFDETGTINVLSAEPKPPVLSAANAVNKVVLTWTEPTLSIDDLPINSAELYYVIYRSDTSGGPFVDPPLTTTLTGVTTYDDTTGTRWQTYYYKVKAVNSISSLESQLSNEASAAPIADQYTHVKSCGVQDPNVYHPPNYPGYLNRPGDVFIDNSKVYVADTDNHRISVFQESDCAFLYTVGTYGLTDGTLRYPDNVMIFAGNIFTLDAFDRLNEFDTAGNPINTYYTIPMPVMMTTDDTSFFITSDNNKVYKVDPSTGGFSATDSFDVNSPAGIAYNPANSLFYISDTSQNKINVYNATGVLQSSIGTSGNDYGQISSPRGIAVDSAGLIYVADTGNNRVQVFNSSGALLNTIGGFGYASNFMREPYSVFISTSGSVWVADRLNQRVSEYIYTGPPM